MFLNHLSTITTSFELNCPLQQWKRDFPDSAKLSIKHWSVTFLNPLYTGFSQRYSNQTFNDKNTNVPEPFKQKNALI